MKFNPCSRGGVCRYRNRLAFTFCIEEEEGIRFKELCYSQRITMTEKLQQLIKRELLSAELKQ